MTAAKGRKGRKFAVRGTALVLEAAAAALVADGLEPTEAHAWHQMPRPGGDLSAALESAKSLAVINPDSPRPQEMLECVVVRGDEALTGHDLALHELLVSATYEAIHRERNGNPSDFIAQAASIPMRQVLTLFGPTARRSHIRRSLAALRNATVSFGLSGGRRYTDVPMLIGWGEEGGGEEDVVRFIMPPPICWLMAAQPRYARVELVAMARMRTRYGVKLYRRLAWRMSTETWAEQASATLIELTPTEAAEWLGYAETPLHVGHLQVAMKRAVADLSDVKGFSVRLLDPRRAHGRGAPLEAFRLSVVLNPPTRHHVPVAPTTESELKHIGGVDAPAFRVNGHVWRKAQTLAKRMKIYTHAIWAHEAWLIALHEALMASRYTEYGYRRFRGAGLLSALRDRPVDDVAWDFILEEFENPDLISLNDNPDLAPAEKAHFRSEAHKARYHRYRDHVAGTERKRKTNPLTEALKAAKFAERVAKQRAEKEEAERLHAAKAAEEAADRRHRFETSDVIIFEADTIDAVGAHDFAAVFAQMIDLWPWTGTRHREVRLWHRVGGTYETKTYGTARASIEDLEEITAKYQAYVPRFRLAAAERTAGGPRRPSFAPVTGVAPVPVEPPRRLVAAPSIMVDLYASDDADTDYDVYDGVIDDGPDEDFVFDTAEDDCPA